MKKERKKPSFVFCLSSFHIGLGLSTQRQQTAVEISRQRAFHDEIHAEISLKQIKALPLLAALIFGHNGIEKLK